MWLVSRLTMSRRDDELTQGGPRSILLPARRRNVNSLVNGLDLSPSPSRRWTVGFVWLVLCLGVIETARAGFYSGAWDLEGLRQAPAFETNDVGNGTSEIVFDVVDGRRVFGYLSLPDGPGPFPALVCISGFGQPARREWAKHHALRGYVALVLDCLGNGPGDTPMADSILAVNITNCFQKLTEGVRACSPYQSVAASVRAVSLLRSLPFVDPRRIGVTGLSWGGSLCCIVAGLDDRVRCAIAVYGAGGLSVDASVVYYLTQLPPATRDLWAENFEPARYLPQARCPMLFINGSNDSFFTMGSTRQSYLAVPGARSLCVRLEMSHGGVYLWPWWQDSEAFLDAWLLGGQPYPAIDEIPRQGGWVGARIANVWGGYKAYFNWTTNIGWYLNRKWAYAELVPTNSVVSVPLPPGTTAYYFAVEESRRCALASTPYQAAQPGSEAQLALRPPGADGGGVWVSVVGQPGAEYQLLRSEDLRDWSPIAQLIGDRSAVEYQDRRDHNSAQFYYRTILIP
jgi:dienelactone hydrolase